MIIILFIQKHKIQIRYVNLHMDENINQFVFIP
jgi:hypothetical protein